MIHVRRDQNFNVAIFSESINVIKVKLCMMPMVHVLHVNLKIYVLILLSVTMTIFQGHSSVKTVGVLGFFFTFRCILILTAPVASLISAGLFFATVQHHRRS